MKNIVIIEQDELVGLSVLIAESIIEYSKKSYGFTMISRDTNTEMSTDAMIGALAIPIRKALNNGIK